MGKTNIFCQAERDLFQLSVGLLFRSTEIAQILAGGREPGEVGICTGEKMEAKIEQNRIVIVNVRLNTCV